MKQRCFAPTRISPTYPPTRSRARLFLSGHPPRRSPMGALLEIVFSDKHARPEVCKDRKRAVKKDCGSGEEKTGKLPQIATHAPPRPRSDFESPPVGLPLGPRPCGVVMFAVTCLPRATCHQLQIALPRPAPNMNSPQTRYKSRPPSRATTPVAVSLPDATDPLSTEDPAPHGQRNPLLRARHMGFIQSTGRPFRKLGIVGLLTCVPSPFPI